MARLLAFIVLSLIICMSLGWSCSAYSRLTTNEATEITATSAKLNGHLDYYPSGYCDRRDWPVYFEWYSSVDNMTHSYTPSQVVQNHEDYSDAITGLTPGMTYYFRAAWPECPPGPSHVPCEWGEWEFFTCRSDPGVNVDTLDATGISSSSATLNGNLPSLLTASSVQVYFRWGTESDSYPNETPRQTMTSPGAFSAEIAGLSPGTTYYFVAKAWFPNTGLTAEGLEESFDVAYPDIAVQTLDASGVSGSSATLNGSLLDLGGHSDVLVYFQWGTSPGSYPNGTAKQTMTSTGAFSAEITGLSPGTTYYFVARAGDTAQGAEESFYLASAAGGTVETLDAGYPAVSTMAWLYGNLVDLGGNASVEVYFLWGANPGVYTHETTHQTMTAPGTFSAMITGPFDIGSTYYFVARVGATGQGEEKSFTVL